MSVRQNFFLHLQMTDICTDNVCVTVDVLNIPVGEFEWEEAFQVWRETATLVSGLLCHMWGQSLLGKHPGIQRHVCQIS